MLIEMEVSGLTVDSGSNTPIVILKEKDGERLLPIWIGVVEASAIAFELEKMKLNRPMTHDLLKNAVESLGGQVEKVSVVALRENTYYALISIAQGGKTIEIDSRPSDAIALALRTQAPILCDQTVIERAHIKESDESQPLDETAAAERLSEDGPRPIFGTEHEDLNALLEGLKPEDFGKYKM
ncbi:MAG: bifunctional nuclease family protein [Myxococcota bacterium]